MDRDFYGILNISRGASKEEIREAYLNLARQYHPDLSQNSNAREQFEEINQAYTILFDDDSRDVYNHLFEQREQFEQREYRAYAEVENQSPSWWQHTAFISAGLGVFAILAGYGLVQYAPTLERGLDSLAEMVQSKQSDFDTLQSEKQLELAQALSPPEPAPKVIETTAQQPTVTAAAPKAEDEKLPSQNAPLPSTEPVPKELEQELSSVSPPTIKPSARNYELLAFYSLVIGDLTQFRNAIKLAYQEDPSFDKLNTLNLSLRQLELEKLPPEIMLKALRGLVLQEYTERLLPSQLTALQANVQNDK
jgi:curved DNA-binding protein CbpA